MKNKSSKFDNDLNKTSGENEERISVSDLLITGDGQGVCVSACRSNKRGKGIDWGSGKARSGWL